MVLPSVFLIHSATLVHTTITGVDAYGQPGPTTTTSEVVSCRFVHPVQRFQGSPVVIQTSPRVLLPGDTVVSVGDTLASTETGFAETFRINSVNVAYEAAVNTVSHISCDIAAVV